MSATRPASRRSSRRSSSSTEFVVSAITPTWSLPSSRGRKTRTPSAPSTSTILACKNAVPAGESLIASGSPTVSLLPGNGTSSNCS